MHTLHSLATAGAILLILIWPQSQLYAYFPSQLLQSWKQFERGRGGGGQFAMGIEHNNTVLVFKFHYCSSLTLLPHPPDGRCLARSATSKPILTRVNSTEPHKHLPTHINVCPNHLLLLWLSPIQNHDQHHHLYQAYLPSQTYHKTTQGITNTPMK